HSCFVSCVRSVFVCGEPWCSPSSFLLGSFPGALQPVCLLCALGVSCLRLAHMCCLTSCTVARCQAPANCAESMGMLFENRVAIGEERVAMHVPSQWMWRESKVAMWEGRAAML